MKILVADDDEISRRIVARILERSGYDVLQADNGLQAAEILLSEDGPRLALVDWMMPKVDGPGLCKRVRARHDSRYIYITLLTAKQASEDIVIGLEAGADDYLIKPCNPEELKARLRTGERILHLEDRLVEAREEMRFQATHDSLTSLWNRRSIVSSFERELIRVRRDNSVMSVLLCDLDYFKQINDVYGHLTGDDVLRQVAARLVSCVRPYDMVGRYGGEEFLVVLIGCDSFQAQKRAEEIRCAIAEIPMQTNGETLFISITIGALTSTDWAAELTAIQLLNEADKALYRAKSRGRNCVESALPLGERADYESTITQS